MKIQEVILRAIGKRNNWWQASLYSYAVLSFPEATPMVSNRLLVREKETSQHGDILLPAKDHGSPGISLPFTNRNLIRLYLISLYSPDSAL